MKENFKCFLNNGWLVYEDSEGKGILVVEPLENSLFRQHKIVELPADVLSDIKGGMIEIKELFKKHKLHNLIIDWEIPKKNPNLFINTENKFYGRGYIVYVEENKYFMLLQLSTHGSGSRKFEISKEIFVFSQNDNLTASDIINKFNLYHLDVPENDVK